MTLENEQSETTIWEVFSNEKILLHWERMANLWSFCLGSRPCHLLPPHLGQGNPTNVLFMGVEFNSG